MRILGLLLVASPVLAVGGEVRASVVDVTYAITSPVPVGAVGVGGSNATGTFAVRLINASGATTGPHSIPYFAKLKTLAEGAEIASARL